MLNYWQKEMVVVQAEPQQLTNSKTEVCVMETHDINSTPCIRHLFKVDVPYIQVVASPGVDFRKKS